MARLRYGDFSVEELTAKIQAANCIALFKSGEGEHPAWTWNPEKLTLEFTVEVTRLQYARAFVLQVKREMHQTPAPSPPSREPQMQSEWKAGDGAYFDPSQVLGGKGFSLGGMLVPIADLPKKIKVLVISVEGDGANIAIDGGEKDGAIGRSYTKNLIPFLGWHAR